MLENPSSIKEAFFQYYKSFFEKGDGKIFLRFNHMFESRLNQNASRELEKPFSMEEIEVALKDSDSEKAPGPDGFNAGWLMALWPRISVRVKEFFDNFFHTGFVPKGANSSFIVLIPKKSNPDKISDFRPIKLINSLFKLLLKVMTLRLKPEIDSLISEEQSAFIKGRNISQSIILVNEVIHSLRKKDGAGLIFKIDFSKAYDSVNWECLFHTMEGLNFGSQWIKWIKSILKYTRMSVIVNGSPTKEFTPRRGLRQGDPLAPYLFIMIGEILHRLLVKAREKGIFEGVSFPYEPNVFTQL